jgi:hypothetical protein
MLRIVVAALVLANLLFFVWVRGWLAPGLPPPRQAESEPERLAQQVRPEAVQVLPAKAASAALNAVREAAAVCLEAGPFAADGLEAAEAALAAAQPASGAWAREPVVPATRRMAGIRRPLCGRRARRNRQQELTKLGLAVEALTAPPELAPGLVLSRHPSRAAAEAALNQLTSSKSLKGARVVELPAPAPRYWLRVARADAELASRLKALPGESLGEGFKTCASPP